MCMCVHVRASHVCMFVHVSASHVCMCVHVRASHVLAVKRKRPAATYFILRTAYFMCVTLYAVAHVI